MQRALAGFTAGEANDRRDPKSSLRSMRWKIWNEYACPWLIAGAGSGNLGIDTRAVAHLSMSRRSEYVHNIRGGFAGARVRINQVLGKGGKGQKTAVGLAELVGGGGWSGLCVRTCATGGSGLSHHASAPQSTDNIRLHLRPSPVTMDGELLCKASLPDGGLELWWRLKGSRCWRGWRRPGSWRG